MQPKSNYNLGDTYVCIPLFITSIISTLVLVRLMNQATIVSYENLISLCFNS